MALKSLSFLMISTLMVAASSLFGVSTALGGRKALARGLDVTLPPNSGVDFVPLDTKDSMVIGLAKYAIDEYNKENNTKLVFFAVFEALYTKSANGTNYGLVVAATDDKQTLNDYNVSVLVVNDTKKLTLFKEDQ